MIHAYLKISNLSDIRRLHAAAESCDYELTVRNGTVAINPKSIVGVLCIDTGSTVYITAKSNDFEDFKRKFGGLISVGC